MSDLAIEFIKESEVLRDLSREICGNRVIYSRINDRAEALRAGKKIGEYYSVLKSNERVADAICDCLVKLAKACVRRKGKIMLVGLGNPRFIADALGDSVLDKIDPDNGLIKVYPSVSAVTGIESTEIITAMAQLTKPRLIIVIDTLCTDSAERLNTVYQMTTAGISPGGGIGGKCDNLDADNLGAPIIAIGVPLAVRLSLSDAPRVFTPIDIDSMVDESADIIARAINKARTKL